ncbi:MAG: aldo/keto reductase [Myxococcota bacterium]|nr:aldo/keto reductase [Myxococcota bacterium]
MRYRQLGMTGTRVSVLCLGAMTFGEAADGSMMHKVGSDEKESFAVLDRAIAAGINFVDTADVYGQDGLSERVLGAWLASRKSRDAVVLATKGRFRMAPGPNGTGASRMRITRAIDASLARLGTDRIDLYQIHMQDLRTPEEELVRALDDAVRAGKIVYFGASNYAAYRLMESLWIADKRGLDRFVTLQAEYNLAMRALEREHVPLCTKFGVGILPWSPLAAGLLTGKYRRGQPPPSGTRFAQWKERYASFDTARNWSTVEALAEVAGGLGRTPSQVALAWLLSRPVVSSVIFGARTVAQLEENIVAGDLELPADVVARLDGVSAPELGYPYDFIKNIDGAW